MALRPTLSSGLPFSSDSCYVAYGVVKTIYRQKEKKLYDPGAKRCPNKNHNQGQQSECHPYESLEDYSATVTINVPFHLAK
jgi:hypothetical protein